MSLFGSGWRKTRDGNSAGFPSLTINSTYKPDRPQTTRLKVREKPARTAAQPSVIRRSTSGIARNNRKKISNTTTCTTHVE